MIATAERDNIRFIIRFRLFFFSKNVSQQMARGQKTNFEICK